MEILHIIYEKYVAWAGGLGSTFWFFLRIATAFLITLVLLWGVKKTGNESRIVSGLVFIIAVFFAMEIPTSVSLAPTEKTWIFTLSVFFTLTLPHGLGHFLFGWKGMRKLLARYLYVLIAVLFIMNLFVKGTK